MDFEPVISPASITFEDLINNTEPDKFQAHTTPLRWAIFPFFFLNILVGSSTSLTFAPIATPMSEDFEVSLQWVNMLSNIYNATYVPMTFLAMYMFNKMTLDWPIRIASILFLAGAWIRSLFVFGNSFLPLMIGQTLISCSFPIFACAITLVANKWYTDTEREMVISVCGIAIPAGILIAFIWTGFAFKGDI